MFEFAQALGLPALEADVQATHYGPIIPRLLAAVAIGFLLAGRPWRKLIGQPLPKLEMIHAQVLLCAAAAVITAVIGNSVAKAFGLVGLGGFVRFRSGLKDPRDAAILFLVIGLGMACGHGSLGLATAGTLFISVLLFAMDFFSGPRREVTRLKFSALTDDPAKAERSLRQKLGARNVLVRSAALDLDGRKLELEVEEQEPGAFERVLQDPEVPPLRGVKWSTIDGRTKEER